MTEDRSQTADDRKQMPEVRGQRTEDREYGSRKGEFGLIPVEIKYTQTVPSIQLWALRDFIKDKKLLFS